jgi:hypothetical protein
MKNKSSENIKYIRHKHTFFAFNKCFVHRDLSNLIFGGDLLIHGAGFINYTKNTSGIEAECHGESISLQVSCRLDDTDLIVDSLGINKPAKFIMSSTRLLMFNSSLDQKEIADKVFNENQKYLTGLFYLSQKSGIVKGVCTDFDGNIDKELTDKFNQLFVC